MGHFAVLIRSAPRRCLLAVVVCASIVLTTGPAVAGEQASAVSPTAVDDRYVRMRLSVTSSAGTVIVSPPAPARVVAGSVVSAAGGSAHWRPDGVLISRNRHATQAKAVIDIVLSGHAATISGWGLRIDSGLATIDLRNINDRARPVSLAKVIGSPVVRSFPVDGAQALRNGPLSTGTAPHDGLVLAHWVPRHRSGDYSRFNNAPLAGPVSTLDPSYVGGAIDQARSAGIDGFGVTWAPYLTPAVDVYMAEAARRPGWRSAIQLNVRFTNEDSRPDQPADAGLLAERLIEVLRRYGTNRSLLRTDDGRAVVFAYQARALTVQDWRRVVETVRRAGEDVAVIGGNVPSAYLAVLDGYFVYNSLQFQDVASVYRATGQTVRTHHLASGGKRKVWMATVTPGMHEWETGGTRFVDREDGALYRRQWAAAAASGADWTYVVSWNEYTEDTTIEPSVRWGRQYLDLTRELVGSS